MQGTLESDLLYGRSTIQAMNQMKIAAAAIGNHELDWGVDTLRARMSESKYPWLAANLVDSATGKRPDWVKPWAMIQVDTPARRRHRLHGRGHQEHGARREHRRARAGAAGSPPSPTCSTR